MSCDKAVLISIKPEWCKLIASGRKTTEIRKNEPKLVRPFRCFIYCTMPNPTHLKDVVEIAGKRINGKVWAEFTCFNIEPFTTDYRQNEEQTMRLSKKSCVSYEDLAEYEWNAHCLFGWHISDLKIYDKPLPLSKFSPDCRYKNEDGECKYPKIVCDCQKFDFNPDGSINVVTCDKHTKKAPQSWCYIFKEDD